MILFWEKLLLLTLFLAILAIGGGTFDQILGSIILTKFVIPINIINAIIDKKPIFEKHIAFFSLLNKKKNEAIEKNITIVTAIKTNIDRFGNSEGEKDEIVNKIKKPPIMVESIKKISLGSMFI